MSSMEELGQTGKNREQPCVALMRAKEAQTRLSELVLPCPARTVASMSVSWHWHLQAWHMGLKELCLAAHIRDTCEVPGPWRVQHPHIPFVFISKVDAERQTSSTRLCCCLCTCNQVTHLCTTWCPCVTLACMMVVHHLDSSLLPPIHPPQVSKLVAIQSDT